MQWVVLPSTLGEYMRRIIDESKRIMESKPDIGNNNLTHESLQHRSRSSTLASNPSHDTPRTPGTPRSPGGPITDKRHQDNEDFWCDDDDHM
jgi:hypothetical protein